MAAKKRIREKNNVSRQQESFRKPESFRNQENFKTPESSPAQDPEKPAIRSLRDNTPVFTWGARIVLFLFLFWFWAIRLADFLYVAQIHDLFLWNVSFIRDYCQRVAGPLFYLTSMGIQSFYYPLIGGTLIALLLSGLEWMTARFFHLERWSAFLSFLPPLLLTLTITQVNYYLFDSFDITFLFAMIPGCFILLLLCCLYQKISVVQWRFLMGIIVTFLCYPLLGFYAVFAALLCLFHEALYSCDVNRKFRLEVLFLFILIIPLFWYLFYKNQVPFSKIFFAGLLEENVIKKDESTQIFFYLPFWGTLFYFFLLAAGKTLVVCFRRKKEESLRVSGSSVKFHFREIVLSVCIIFMMIGTIRFSFFPNNFKILLKTVRLLDECRWNDILQTERKVPYQPVNPLISARVLSLVRTDQIGDHLFDRPLEPKLSLQLKTISSMMMLGDRILFEHGQLNMAARNAMNCLADRNGRSVWPIKTLALCAMATGEKELAKRYLNILDDTLFYRDWSRGYREWLDHDGSKPMSDSVQAINDRILDIRNRKGTVDYFNKSKAVDYAVMEHYQHYDFESASRERMIAQLMIRLQVSDLDGFLAKVDIFLKKYGNEPIPRHIQEALLFDSWYMKKNGIDESRCHYSPEILERFRKFTSTVSKMGTNPSPEQLAVLELDYSNTAWYHLTFITQIEIY